jgi:hypothetical protein
MATKIWLELNSSQFSIYDNTTSWATAFTDMEAAYLMAMAVLLLDRDIFQDMSDTEWNALENFLSYVIRKLM